MDLMHSNNHPISFLMEIDKLILKFTKKCKGPRIVKTTWKNIHLIYCYKNSDHIVLTQRYYIQNKTKSPEKERPKCCHLIYNKDDTEIQRRK